MSAFVPVYDRDLTIVSGKGSRLLDRDGRRYLDFAAGIGVNGLGHRDRRVLAATRAQAARLVHVSNLFHNEPALALAERLSRLFFPACVFLCNSGTEGVEAALKFARRIGGGEGRTELLAFEGAFHGRTCGALSLTWKARYREPFEPLLPGVGFVPFGDLPAAEAAIGPRTAAVFVEPVQGEGGVWPAGATFLQGLARLCRERGALLVADEVQCGLGRTGRLLACEHAGVVPDLVVLAKPLGGGLPLGAVLVREDLASRILPGDHGSTFGGNPVACAAALAVLDRLASPGFLAAVERRGRQLLAGLRRLARAHPETVSDVRGLGLMAGLEVRGEAKDVLAALRRRGVLATKAGDHVLRLLPPLVVRAAEVREFLDVLGEVLAEGAGSGPGAAEGTGEGGRR